MDKSKGTRTRKLAAALTAGVLMGQGGDAFAGGGGNVTFADMSDNIVTASGGLPNLISTVAYVGGIGLGVAGIFKLKQHVDNPGQTPMKDGLVRLACGGGLLAFPFIQQAMQGSISNGSLTAISAKTLLMDNSDTFS